MSDPKPGTGVSYDPNEQKPTSKAAAEAGIVQAANPSGAPIQMGQLIRPLPDDELEAELEELTAEDFIAKHTRAEDANRDTMARVLRMTRDEVAAIQRELGFPLPDGI